MWFALRLRAISQTLISAQAHYPLAARLLRKQGLVHFFRRKSARKYRLVSDRIMCDRITAGLWSIAICLFLMSPSDSSARPPAALASQPAALAPRVAAPVTPFAWNANDQGQFILSSCRDLRGDVWVGTEGQGVWRFDPRAASGKPWTQFTAQDGLGDDDIYALACDRQGRIWAGTASHGVSVFTGQPVGGRLWHTYDQMTGPLGAHVGALAVGPLGDIWMATEAGLARYGDRTGHWSYFTRADGLPSDQAGCLAFGPDGTLYVGTLCDGIAIASPADDYASWRVVPGPGGQPRLAKGKGLPSAQINALLVARNGSVFVGTPYGLAFSADRGRSWEYVRGADYLDSANGQFDPMLNGFTDNAKINGIEVVATSLKSRRQEPLKSWRGAGAFFGGTSATSDVAVRMEGVSSPAPQAVYQTERWGNSAYSLAHLKPNAPYRVRLHFAEIVWGAAGKRMFNVLINGKQVLNHFDILAAAGGQGEAIVKEFNARADGYGKLLVQFQGPGPLVAPPDPHLLLEDYVTALAEDGTGHLLVGHRQQGLEAIDRNGFTRLLAKPGAVSSSDYVMTLLPQAAAGVLVGRYGGGATETQVTDRSVVAKTIGPQPGRFAKALVSLGKSSAADILPAMPFPAAPPTAAQLLGLLRRVQVLKAPVQVLKAPVQALKATVLTGAGTLLGQDWQTKGDWVGRYGRQYAVLCAAAAPLDQTFSWNSDYSVTGQSGPHRNGEDSLRYWVTWHGTDNPNTLYSPVEGKRIQAEWDDHGEVYAQTYGGPDVWITVTVPEGNHRLSLYDFNKDGHDGMNRYRDYLVDLLAYRNTLQEASTLPPLARGRIVNFWNGQYLQFQVSGPSRYYVRIAKQGSFNTLCTGVFLDKLQGTRTHSDQVPLPFMGGVRYGPPLTPVIFPPVSSPPGHPGPIALSPTLVAAQSLWEAVDQSSPLSVCTSSELRTRLLALRALREAGGPSELQEAWRWHLGLWTEEDRLRFRRTMAQAWRAQNLKPGDTPENRPIKSENKLVN